MATTNLLAYFDALSGQPPATNYATLDIRNGVTVLDFDDSTDESIDFGGYMPAHYSGGGFTVVIGWMATTATSGTISLDVAFKSVTDDADDLDTKAYAAVNNANPTTASATGEVDYVTITFTDGADSNSVAAGEYFMLRVTRDANGTTSTDNLVGDMELVFVAIKET